MAWCKQRAAAPDVRSHRRCCWGPGRFRTPSCPRTRAGSPAGAA
jgi:hypothetical protein